MTVIWQDTLDAAANAVAGGFNNYSYNRQTNAGNDAASGLAWPPLTVTSPGAGTGKAVSLGLPALGRRYELEPNTTLFAPGITRYFTLNFYLGTDFSIGTVGGSGTYGDATGYQVITQIRNQTSAGSPPIAFEVMDGYLCMTGGYDAPNGPGGSARAYKTNLATVTTGKWYQLTFAVTFTVGAGAGSVSAWLDGTQVLTNYAPACGTHYGDGDAYWKVGYYRDPRSAVPSAPASTISYNKMRVADTYADSQISNDLAMFPTGMAEDFNGATLDTTKWPTINGAGLTGVGQAFVNASYSGGNVYSQLRSKTESAMNKTVVWNISQLPAGNANAQLWIQDSVPANTVDRLGFEYVGNSNRMDCLGQSGSGYTPLGGAHTQIANWSTISHTWFRIRIISTAIYWDTSADGITWVNRRTLTATPPAWLSTTRCRVGVEATRNAAGTNDTFRINSMNMGPYAAPVTPLSTTPSTGTDAFQRRNLFELRAWNAWLTANGAKGFVGEHGHVTHWAAYGDATHQAKWDALLENYLNETEYLGIDGAYWASGREWGSGYPMGMHVGATKGDALTATYSGSTNLAAHPTRLGVNRGVNLAGHEDGVASQNTDNGVRTKTPLIHTAADFAYLKSQGVNLVRLPISWERLQTAVGNTLDAAALNTLDTMLTAAANNGIQVVLDLHNYARYTTAGNVVNILGGGLTTANLTDFWTKMSTWVKSAPARNATVVAYGIMNEPHDMPTGVVGWESASQAVVTAIRANTDTRLIYVGGYGWSSLTNWTTNHTAGWITDSANNFKYEAHHYWDTTSVAPRSGTYTQASTGTATEYATELAAAVAWETGPVEKTGSGDLTTTSDGSGYPTGAHAGPVDPSESSSDGLAVGSGGHGGSGDTNVSVDGSGLGKAEHVGAGSTDSFSETYGEGRDSKEGATESYSDGSGEASGGHQGSGALDYSVDGYGYPKADHKGTGTPVDSSTSGSGYPTGAHKGSSIPTVSNSTTDGKGYAKQFGSAGIARPNVGISIRLINSDGTIGDFLPDWVSIAYTDMYNAAGTIAIEYAKKGVNASKFLKGRAEGALFDGTYELPSTRFLVTQMATDGVKEDQSGNVTTINAPLYVPSRLAEATVYPPAWPKTIDVKTQFSAVTPGYIIGTLIARAKSRGGIPEIGQFFSASKTTDNKNWANLVTLEVEPGGSILSVLEKLTEMGVCDWKSYGRELVLLNPDNGVDLTIIGEPVILQAGRDMTDAPEKTDVTSVYTHMLITGKDGLTVEVADPNAVPPRVEGFLSISGVDDTGTLRAIGEKAIAKSKLETESFTHGLTLFDALGPQPWVDYHVGDYLFRDTGNDQRPTKYRVAQLSVTYDNVGMVSGAITLGTRFDTLSQKLQSQIDALTNGSTGEATSPANSPAEDRIAPLTPAGLLVTSEAYSIDNGGGTMAALYAAWSQVTMNADGSPCKDLDHYDVRWRNLQDGPVGAPGGNSDKADAAAEVLQHIRFFGDASIYEDFSFRGYSANLAYWNDDLAGGYWDDYPAVATHEPYANYEEYLGLVIQQNQPAISAAWHNVPGVKDPSARWSDVPSNLPIAVQVRAVDQWGNASAWSAEVSHITAKDDIPPAVPSAPTASNYLGTVKIAWDGKPAAAGTNMDVDFEYADLYRGNSVSFSIANGTRIDRFTGAGSTIDTGVTYDTTYYYRLIAYDHSGNASALSVAGSAVPAKLVNIDFGPDSVDRLQIRDGAIGTAEIENLAVNDAKIGNLSVGKLTAGNLTATVITTTGSFNTGTDVQNRITLNNTGIFSYIGNQLKFFLNANGTSLFTGQISTATTGKRIVLNPGGSTPDELRLYRNNSETDYGVIRMLDFGGAGVGMNMRSGGAGGRGELLVQPGRASLTWGDASVGYIESGIIVDGVRTLMQNDVIDLCVDLRHNYARQPRISQYYIDGNGNLMADSVVEYRFIGNQFPAFVANGFNADAGWSAQAKIFVVLNATGYDFRPIKASAFYTSSSLTRKQNITDLSQTFGGMTPLDVVDKIEVKEWEYITTDGETPTREIGPIAEELLEVAPFLVDGDTPKDYAISATRMAILSIAAVRELHDEVKELRSRL